MKKSCFALIFKCFFALAVLQTSGAEIFVSPKGDDKNPGTAKLPLATIAKAYKLAKPGDTVKLLPGTFFEQLVLQRSGRPDARITIAGTRGKNGEFLSVVQAPGKVISNWQAAPEIGGNVWKAPLEKRPDLVMMNGAMVSYINHLTMDLPQRKVLPKEIIDEHIISKFGPKCKRLAGLDLLRTPEDIQFTHQYMGNKRVSFWETIGNVLTGWHKGYLYVRLNKAGDISSHRFTVTYGEGISVKGASNITIKDLLLRASRMQVRIMEKSTNNIVENCLLMHGGFRVRIDKGASNNTVRNNIMTCGFIRNDLFRLRAPNDMRGGALYEIFKYIIGTSLSDDVGVGNYGSGSKIIDNIIVQGLIGIRAFGPDVTVSGNVVHGMSSVGIVTNSQCSGRFFRNLVTNCGIPLRLHEYCNDKAKREEYHYNNLFVQNRHEGQHTLVHCYNKFAKIYRATPAQSKKMKVPKVDWNEKTYIYHNTFWGGNDDHVSFTVSRHARTFRRVMPFFMINNIYKNHPWLSTTSHELAGPNLLYSFKKQDKNYRDKKVPKINKVVGVKESEVIWNRNDLPGLPDLSLAQGSPAARAGVDISQPFTVNGKTYPALLGFKPGYFKGSAPAAGALQEHESMAFFADKFKKAVSAMKMLEGFGIKMPVPGIKMK